MISRRHAYLFSLFILICLCSDKVHCDTVEVPERNDIGEDRTEETLPDVLIIREKDQTKYEYRVNGKLVMIKIVPIIGKPYYLVNKNHTGHDNNAHSREATKSTSSWIIKKW